MTGNETIYGYTTAMEKISQLKAERKKSGLTQKELSRQSGVNVKNLSRYENGQRKPSVKNYNQLSRVLGWEEITESTPRREVHYPSKPLKPKSESLSKTVRLSGIGSVRFEEGQRYRISETPTGDQDAVKGCVFCYEGKQGLHHMFREERGKWTRTYTDAQLIGKYIKEE